MTTPPASAARPPAAGPRGARLTGAGVTRGARDLASVAAFAVLPFGVGFGAAAAEQGLTPAQALIMSALAFSGVVQFAALEFWRGAMTYGVLALVTIAINARLIMMSAAMAPWVNAVSPARRAASLAMLSDANFAAGRAELARGADDLGPYLGGGLVLWSAWVAGTAVGVAAGAVLGDLSVYGLDMVMACFFVTLAAGQIQGWPSVAVMALAAAVAALTAHALPVGWNVVVAALAGGALNAALHWREDGAAERGRDG